MKTKVKTRAFEGVKTMLSIKAEISRQYSKNPYLILEKLSEVREKYNLQSTDRKKLPLT